MRSLIYQYRTHRKRAARDRLRLLENQTHPDGLELSIAKNKYLRASAKWLDAKHKKNGVKLRDNNFKK